MQGREAYVDFALGFIVFNTLFFELSIIEKGTVGCPTPLQTQILNSPIMSQID